MVILNLTKQSVPARNARYASSFGDRLAGLIGKRFSSAMDGMVFDRCNAIHTFFMRYPIDAHFLDRNGNVVKVVRNIRPWRLFVWGGWRARSVLETAADCAENKEV